MVLAAALLQQQLPEGSWVDPEPGDRQVLVGSVPTERWLGLLRELELPAAAWSITGARGRQTAKW